MHSNKSLQLYSDVHTEEEKDDTKWKHSEVALPQHPQIWGLELHIEQPRKGNNA